MPKFIVEASETVYYWKEVEADSAEQIKDMVFNGEISFEVSDITDGDYFELTNIQEDRHEPIPS